MDNRDIHDAHSERALAVLKELAAGFIRDEANAYPLITVIRTSASPDFKNATIFVSVYPEDREDESIIFLKRKGTEFRDYIKKHGAFKRIPFFNFEIDYGERKRQQLDEVVRDIEKKDAL